jgi:5-methylcytosine-specific restriction endonuclease McrA
MSRKAHWQGMNWLRKDKRIAIYMRDKWQCVYCNSHDTLSLDHIQPVSKGGSNHETNLITACLACNSARGNIPLCAFTNKGVRQYIHKQKRKKLKRHAAKDLLAAAESFLAVVRDHTKST